MMGVLIKYSCHGDCGPVVRVTSLKAACVSWGSVALAE